MQPLIDLAQKNPALVAFLWTVVLWPVVSALGNKLLDAFVPRADAAFAAYEQVHPRFAAMVKLVRKLGFDPHAVVDRVRQVLNGKPPPLPAVFGVEPNASVTKMLVHSSTTEEIPFKVGAALLLKGTPLVVQAQDAGAAAPAASPERSGGEA